MIFIDNKLILKCNVIKLKKVKFIFSSKFVAIIFINKNALTDCLTAHRCNKQVSLVEEVGSVAILAAKRSTGVA